MYPTTSTYDEKSHSNIMTLYRLDILERYKHKNSSNDTTGGLDSPPLSRIMWKAVQPANNTRSTATLANRPYHLSKQKDSAPFPPYQTS